MHLYNAWLPPPVLEEIQDEEHLLGEAVAGIRKTWNPDDPHSKFSTLKWTSFANNLVRAKIVPDTSQLDEFVKLGFDVFFHSSDNLFVQVRWSSCLTRLLNKFRKLLTLQLDWRPFYELLVNTHFKRRDSVEGAALKQIHTDSIVSLISYSRRFFRPKSAEEVWSEFSPYLEDVIHNGSLEAVGFMSLLLPTEVKEGEDFLNSAWFKECLRIWDTVHDCLYWDRQWASLLGRFIKDRVAVSNLELQPLLPSLFGHYLNSFEVPVAKSEASSPIQRDVPYDIQLAFNSGLPNLAKDVARGIVYLLRPDNSAQACFEQLVDLLEQYYHPSNGGLWSSSLEQLLRNLSYYFVKRISTEQRKKHAGSLRPSDLEAFVKSMSRLIERAHYSKNKRLAATASTVASSLAFVAPSIMLPFIVTQFETALVTETATHQLKSALKTLALSSRAVLLAASSRDDSDAFQEDVPERLSFVDCKAVLVDAMSTTLLGMDANDPPKTVATLQFYSSVISSVGILGDVADGGSTTLAIDWTQWLDEFLSRLFALIRHVESGTHADDLSEETFLMESQSQYSVLLELLFSRLSKPLLQLALKKVANFVLGSYLPGALSEVGSMCSALVFSDSSASVANILVPMMENIRATLHDVHAAEGLKGSISPATETSVASQITLLSYGVVNAGPALLQCKQLIKDVLDGSFKTSSVKVNEASDRFLSSLFETMLLYYPIDQYRPISGDGVETWIDMKTLPTDFQPSWHLPSKEELQFSEELLQLHLRDAIDELQSIIETKQTPDKDKLRVLLLRINGSLRGIRSCLPDFGCTGKAVRIRMAGKAGVHVANSQLREHTADVLLQASEYFLKVKADDTALLHLLVRSLDLVLNYGSSDYNESLNGKHDWRFDAKTLAEPKTNYITDVHSVGKRRPAWLITEMVYYHNLWRASQAGYRKVDHGEIPSHVRKLTAELLKLALVNYTTIRGQASAALLSILKRFPPLVKSCIPVLTSSLEDPESSEHACLGACTILSSRPILRHVAQDWSSLAMFMMAVLRSSHHESIKAQTAISELALAFSMRFGGVPASNAIFSSNGPVPSYEQLMLNIEDSLKGNNSVVHWRYNLMAHVALLCLALPVQNGKALKTRESLAGKFLNGLGSDLPPLRPLCTVGLLLLLYSASYKKTRNPAFSVKPALLPTIQEPSFAGTVIKNLSLDHHFSEEHGRSAGARSQSGNLSVVNVLPSFVRHWPSTRGWSAKGYAFSPKFANLFKRLIQECGPEFLEAVRSPLEEAANAVEEKGMQCIAAEVIGGILRSEVPCVSEAWDEWLGKLFRKTIMQANVESIVDWTACVRFSVSNKGRKGNRATSMRYKVLQTVLEPVSSSSSFVSKRLQYIVTALMEFRPLVNMDTNEATLHLDLLTEVMSYMTHPSPQVRQHAGKIICLVCTNLQDVKATNVPDWTKLLVDGAKSATLKIQQALAVLPDGMTASSTTNDTQDAVKYMETVLQFVICAMLSGRAAKAMPVLVGVIQPVLALQETSHKDMSSYANIAMYLYQWQPFSNEYHLQAVSAIISAANDNVWRARAAALTFIQSFIYRHAFVLGEESIHSLWSCVKSLLSDPQIEVREQASTTLSGMLRGTDNDLATSFREDVLNAALKQSRLRNSKDKVAVNGIVMGLRACILSAPYDVPRWLPDIIEALTKFSREPSPVSTVVSKTIAEFKRTHADAWAYQKNLFSQDQLEVLSGLSSSASYFA